MEWATNLADLGAACVLGGFIFIMYRIDRKDSEKRLTQIIKDEQSSRDKNTAALQSLTSAILYKNGHGGG